MAAAIAYLLMAALFGNFIYPVIIMFTLPFAAVGGLIGLKLVNLLITSQATTDRSLRKALSWKPLRLAT